MSTWYEATGYGVYRNGRELGLTATVHDCGSFASPKRAEAEALAIAAIRRANMIIESVVVESWDRTDPSNHSHSRGRRKGGEVISLAELLA